MRSSGDAIRAERWRVKQCGGGRNGTCRGAGIRCADRICSAMRPSQMIFRKPLLISISIFMMATADVSGAWLGPSARAAYRRLIDAGEQQAAHPPAHAGSAAGAEQDDTVRLRHRSEISNPYHVEFRDVTSAAGIRFHHERASSPQRLYPETMGAGVGWIDYNQDGYLDAIFVNSGYTPYYHPLLRSEEHTSELQSPW